MSILADIPGRYGETTCTSLAHCYLKTDYGDRKRECSNPRNEKKLYYTAPCFIVFFIHACDVAKRTQR